MEDALDKQEDTRARDSADSAADVDADAQAGQAGAAGPDDTNDGGADDADGGGATRDAGADEPGAPADAPADASAEAEIAATVEAILFATDNPLSAAKIALVAELPGRVQVKKAVAQLNERYDRMGSAFCIEPIAGGYQMLTRPQYHDVVSRLFKNKSDARLSQAALETLAIVAYRQPILRADIEAVRGVASGEMLRGLMEKNLVKIVGRAEVLGRPMLYGTTRQFLEVFGLNDIQDLPNVEALRGGRDANASASAKANGKKAAAPAAASGDEQPAEQPASADPEAHAQAHAQPPPPAAAQHAQEPQEPQGPAASENEDSDPPPESL